MSQVSSTQLTCGEAGAKPWSVRAVAFAAGGAPQADRQGHRDEQRQQPPGGQATPGQGPGDDQAGDDGDRDEPVVADDEVVPEGGEGPKPLGHAGSADGRGRRSGSGPTGPRRGSGPGGRRQNRASGRRRPRPPRTSRTR